MNSNRFDVVTVGNAIMDVLVHVNEAFLATHALHKGTMPAVECSGGSAANTAVGIAALGGQVAYVGKVNDDPLGRAFLYDINTAGVQCVTPPLREGPPTGRCLILVTPDAQRTMNTYLGACVALGPDDIDPALIQNARITYLEGYQWDAPMAKEAIRKAADLARASRKKVALSLSDPFCVERHRVEFYTLVRYHVDILFANEAEIMSLYQTTTFDDAVQAVRRHCVMAAISRGEKGSVITTADTVHVIDAVPVARVVDTTGAGDLFAAGFLYGLSQDKPPALCARIGSLCAAEIIGHFGARPERSLADWVKERFG
ncbi:MAG: putative carbohydrate/purine kinase [Rhodospirillaceae bacterium]|nr:MAG: putative carbohydrate/purine kinase [Rhodospirillaceae bacterium]